MNPELVLDVGYLDCTLERLHIYIKYVIAQRAKDQMYVLFADLGCVNHESIVKRMIRKNLLKTEDKILGGGRLRAYPQGENELLSLEGYSEDYGYESDEIREAFRPLVLQKLKEIGIELV